MNLSKICLFIISLLFISSLTGCITTIVNPAETKLQQDRFEYEKQQKVFEKIEKKRLVGHNRILRLRTHRIKEKELLRLPKPERELILLAFKDSSIILKAFEKLGCSMFDIVAFLNEYGKADLDGFCDFLENKYPFTTWNRWSLDKEVFIPAKRNYELLKRITPR